MEHRLVGVGRAWPGPSTALLVGVGTVGWVWSVLGTLLGPEGSGFGLSFSGVGLHRLVGACSCGPTRGRTARPLVFWGVGRAPVWGRSPPVA